MKKFLLLTVGLAILVIAMFLGGCGTRQTAQEEGGITSGEVYPENGLPKDQKVTLRMIYPVMGEGTAWIEEAIKSFEARFPNVKIDMRYIQGGHAAYDPIIRSLLQSGDDNEMYDWVYSFPQDLDVLIEQGQIEKQDELWERSLYDRPDLKLKDAIKTASGFLPGQHVDGHLYGSPVQTGIRFGIYYNKKMFWENGWNERPRNWPEFLTLSAQIKAKGIYPMVMAAMYPNYISWGWGAIPYQVAGEAWDEAVRTYQPNIYKSKPYLTMLKRLEEYARKGYFHPGTPSLNHTQTQMEFVQGKVAMITVGTWVANEMRDVVSPDFEWGFMPTAGNEPGQQQIMVLTGSQIRGVIWKGRPELNKKWAKEFNLWLLNMSVQEKFAESGAIPARIDFTDDPARIKKASPSVIAALQASQEPQIKLLQTIPAKRKINNAEMAKVEKVSGDGLISIINGQKTAEQVAEEINKQYMRGLAMDKKGH